MSSTLTMPENLDAVEANADASYPTEANEDAMLLRIADTIDAEHEAESIDTESTEAEVASDDSDTEAAAILESITGQTLDGLAAQMDAADAVTASESSSESTLDDAATTPSTSCSSPSDAASTPRLSASDDFLIQIQNAETECRRTDAVVVDLKEQLKEAKANYDSAVNKPRKLASGVAEMMANDAERPLFTKVLDSDPAKVEKWIADADAHIRGEPTTEAATLAASSPSDVTNIDTSTNWPDGHVPSQVEILKDYPAYGLESGTTHDCCLDDADGVNVDDVLLQQGDFRVVAWREQTDQDVIPDYVLAFRAEQSIAAESAPPTDSDAADEASWRAFRIEDLDDLSDGTVGALHNADIETVGQLADYTAGGKRLTDIPKLGKAKVSQIEAASLKFFEERPDRKAGADQ